MTTQAVPCKEISTMSVLAVVLCSTVVIFSGVNCDVTCPVIHADALTDVMAFLHWTDVIFVYDETLSK
jgi:hypothetical protein